MDDESIRKRLKRKNNPEQANGFKWYKCPVCGKTFTTSGTVQWGWYVRRGAVTNKRVVCSYSCMRKAEQVLKEA